MRVMVWTVVLTLAAAAGCGGRGEQPQVQAEPAADRQLSVSPPASAPSEEEKEIQAALEELSPEDRALAQAQQYCPVMEESRLGSMGTPIKVMVKGQPVFLCCKGCQRRALTNPEKTLARVEQLKKGSPNSP